ncbi:MAG: lysophospholipid acyltransferase family protein [Planctomycetota bacterium]
MLVRAASALLYGLTRFLVGGHARWRGVGPVSTQRIYFANHASHLDTVLLWAALPPRLRRRTHPVAALDYWGTGTLRRFIALRVLGAVLIDRQGASDPLAPLRATLEQGHSLILFPEGTRRDERLPGPFKSGLFRLATAFPQVELVPVYLENLARAFPKGAFLPAPIQCVVNFGAALPRTAEECKDDFLERARQAVCELAPEIHP